MPSYRAKPVSNEFLSMFWETIGLLTDIRPMFHIVDIANDGKYSEDRENPKQSSEGLGFDQRL